MAEVVKALLAAPINAVLVVAGLAFLAVAVFRRITDRLDAGPKGRLFAGLVGIALIALSLYLSAQGPTPDGTTSATAAPSNTPSNSPSTGSYPIDLPAGQVIKGEDHTYTLLKITLDRHQIDQLALTITVRMHNQGRYPANFWNARFRLLVDDVPVAPFSDLNEVVDGNAAQEGKLSFAIPAGTRNAALQIDQFGPDAAALPIALPAHP